MMFYNTSELNFRAISNRTSDHNAEFDKRNEHVLMCVSQCVCETEKTIRITESEGLREMKKREIKSLGWCGCTATPRLHVFTSHKCL